MTALFPLLVASARLRLTVAAICGLLVWIPAAAQFGPTPLVDVPALHIDLPPEPRPWDNDLDELVAALAAEDGHAIIGFKAPASPLRRPLRASSGCLPAGLTLPG